MSETTKAFVVDGGGGDVGAEVFDGVGTGAGGQNVDSPIQTPDGWVDTPGVFLEEPVEMLSESGFEEGQMDQEVRAFDLHEVVVVVETSPGDQAMDVGMETEFLVPGVKDGDKAVGACAQGLVVGELFVEGGGDGLEEQIVSLLGVRTEELAA